MVFPAYYVNRRRDVLEQIDKCEANRHKTQVAYSGYHKALTLICFTCRMIVTNMGA